MMFRPLIVVASAAMAMSLACPAWAQRASDNPDWVESEVPPPPAFDVSKVIDFDVSRNGALRFGVDPSTVQISLPDSLVRYVVVARSDSGAMNVMYEGLRCGTGEFKTYARYTVQGGWKQVADPQWRSMQESMPSMHPLRLARAGACDNSAPVTSVATLVQLLGKKGSDLRD